MHICLLIQTRLLFHWMKQYYRIWTHNVAKSNGFKVKTPWWWICFFKKIQLFISEDINWWTGVVWITCGLLWCFYQLFGLILTAPIHCRGSIGEQEMWCYISPNLFWWRNKLIYISNGLRMTKYSANFHFLVNYFYKVRWIWMTVSGFIAHQLKKKNRSESDSSNITIYVLNVHRITIQNMYTE